MPDLGPGHIIVILLIVGFVCLAIVDKIMANRREERVHRERLAMIDRGIMPSPEADPAKFETSQAQVNAALAASLPQERFQRRRAQHPRDVARTLGTLAIAGGLGTGILLYSLEEPGAFGIGAFMCIMGVAFFVLSMFTPAPPEQGR